MIETFTTFGGLLHFLRRRARLTQRELAIAANYSEAHVSRLEGGQRIPDMTTLIALIIPALDLDDDPSAAARLIELAADMRGESVVGKTVTLTSQRERQDLETWTLESIPALPVVYVEREQTMRLRDQLKRERCVAVSGWAGVGKTTLVAAVAQSMSAVQPIFWLSMAGEATPVDLIIRQLAIFLATLGDEHVLILTEKTPDGEASLPFERQVMILRAALQRHAALLCFDNVHTVQNDQHIRHALEQFAQHTMVAIVLISREHLTMHGYSPFSVAGFNHADGQRLLEQLAIQLEPDHAVRLIDHTSGNPTLIRLAAGQLHEQFDSQLLDELAHEPHVAAYLVDQTLNHLSSDAQKLAELLACLDMSVDLSDKTLTALAFGVDGRYDWRGATNELVRLHVIEHPSRASLPPLICDHVYAGLHDATRRAALHRAVAQWLEGNSINPVAAAEHYFKANDISAANDMIFSSMNEIIERGQALNAVALVDQLMPIVRRNQPDMIVPLLQQRGELLMNTDRAEEAERSFREALSLAVKPTVRAHLVIRLAANLMQRNQVQESWDLVNDALDKLAPSDALLRSWLLVVRGNLCLPLGKLPEAQANAEEAIRLAEQLDDHLVLLAAGIRARASATIGIVMMLTGRLDEGVRHWQTVIIAAEAAGLSRLKPRGLFNLGSLQINRGDFAAALEAYNQAIVGMRRMNDVFNLARIAHGLSVIHGNRAEWDEALAQLTTACELKQTLGDHGGWLASRNQQAMTLLHIGRVDEALAIAQEVVQSLDSTNVIGQINFVDTLATAHLLLNDVSQAQHLIDQIKAQPIMQTNQALHQAVATHEAWTILIRDGVDAAQVALDATPTEAMAQENKLEHELTLAMLALLKHDPNAHSMLQATRDRARSLQYEVFARAAERLLAAPSDITLLNALRLFWYAN